MTGEKTRSGTLSDFGAGIEQTANDEADQDDGAEYRQDGARIHDRCQATTAEGEQCRNAVTPRIDGPYCASHGDRGDSNGE